MNGDRQQTRNSTHRSCHRSKEIEAQLALQLRHAHDRWPLDIELLQECQILVEHRVVSAFAVHFCPSWLPLLQDVETFYTLSRHKGEMLTDLFGPRQKFWAYLLLWMCGRGRHLHRNQEPPTSDRTKSQMPFPE